MTRPSWDTYFLQIAQMAAKRSTCPRAEVGCVLVVNKYLISSGYNGAESGKPHCTDVGCDIVDNHCLRAIHAEKNAITIARKLYRHNLNMLVGATLYCTHAPCLSCAEMIADAGVMRVVYRFEYSNDLGFTYLLKNEIEVERV